MANKYSNKRQDRRDQRHTSKKELQALEKDNVTVEEEFKEPEAKKLRKIDKVRTFVLDTNILISCPDIIPDPGDPDWRKPLNFEPNLDNAQLVIPAVVHDELEGIKKGHGWRAKEASLVLKRLAKLMPAYVGSLQSSLDLSSSVKTGIGTQTISILALHKNLQDALPIEIKDNDGWVAVTALVVNLINKGKKVDGSEPIDLSAVKSKYSDVCLLTKDNGLIVKAYSRMGVYAYKCTFDNYPPFTGCRELFVPTEMFKYCFVEEKLTEEEFLSYMPEQLPLLANEYVILKLENEKDYPKNFLLTEGYYTNVLRFDKKSRTLKPIAHWRKEGEAIPQKKGKWPQNQPARMAAYYDALNDPRIKTVVTTGDGGTGKTYTPLVHAIKKVRANEFDQIVFITTLSSKLDCGAIPGKLEEKLDPLVSSCKDAIRSYVESFPKYKEMRENLQKGNKAEFSTAPSSKGGKKRKDTDSYKDQSQSWEEKGTYKDAIEREVDSIFRKYFTIAPYETIQGRSFNRSIVFLDEFQRVEIKNDDGSLNNAVTMLTRCGEGSKMIVTGDYSQIPKNNPEKMMLNGLYFATQLLKDEENAAFIHLTENQRNESTGSVFKNLAKVKEKLGLY